MSGKDANFVYELVNTFSTTERQCLMLHYVEQLTTLEISVILEVSEQEVRNTLASMRARTRASLKARKRVTRRLA